MNLILFERAEITEIAAAGITETAETAPPPEAGPPLSEGGFRGCLSLRDERTVHLLKVLHKKAGDTFEAGLLGGKMGAGLIEETGLDGLHFSLNLDREPLPRLPIRVLTGFPRPIQLRRLLRDLSSLGVQAVDLAGTDLGEKSYRDTKLLEDGGARAALVEGAVQSRDTSLPELRVFPRLDDWLRECPWDQEETPPLLAAADNVRPQGSFAALDPAAARSVNSAVLAVGSERGWSERERDMLEAAGFLRLSLGSRALRTETACIAAAALLMAKTGLLD